MRDFIIACQFLTRITINPNLEVSREDMGTSAVAYPLVGFLVGICLAISYLVLHRFLALPILTSAVFITVVEILITGGLHLDGLMDCADGLLSYRPREKILEIMKDSTVGANAVLAVVSVLLIKIGLYLVILPEHAWFLLLMPLVSRWILLDLAVHSPYGGKEGSFGGTVIGQAGKKEFWQGSLWAFGLTGLIGVYVWKTGPQSPGFVLTALVIPWLAGYLTAQRVAKKAEEKIGGVTGDVLGAALELTEIATLLALIILCRLAV